MSTKKFLYGIFFLFLFQSNKADSPLSQAINNKYCNIADYVIVGIGTAGATMAKLLTDDLQTSVIGLHNDENLTEDQFLKFSANAPLVVASALFDSPYFQTGQTTPQPNADNRQLLWVLPLPEGGGSEINAGAWCRGTNTVYAQWEAIAGPNWSVSRITDIYKQLEDYSGLTTNPGARGFSGPIPVRQAPNPTEVSIKFTQAITAATGLPFVLDYNDPNTLTGPSTQLQYTQFLPNGTLRASSATIFLNEQVMTPDGFGVNGRKLRVHFNATALRTLWNGTTAIGVEYMQDGEIQQVYANKGVIVCAGLFSSAFLMHSGIGPSAVLEPLDIPVIYDNPNVGQQLADHTRINLFFSTNPDDTPQPPVDPNNFLNNIAWLPDPLGIQSVRAFDFVTTNVIPGVALALCVLTPAQSRGSITINSADPLQPPVIDEGVLTNSQDLQTFVNFFMITLNNINTQLQLIDPLYELIYPDPAILSDPVAVTAFIRASVDSNEHYQSHCRMAPINQGGVVDSSGHVYGVQNLIVADDSIVPQSMDGSPMATAYLIAANIAQLIKGS